MQQPTSDSKADMILRDNERSDSFALAQLARTAFGLPWTEEFINWKYFQNPSGRIFGCIAEKDGKIMGFHGNLPVEIKFDEQIIIGAQSMDAMVMPKARRQGLFLRMANYTYEQMDDAGIELTYGYPGPVTMPAFLIRLAWTFAGGVPRFIKVLEPGAMLQSGDMGSLKTWGYRAILRAVQLTAVGRDLPAPSEVKVREIGAFDERFDGLWREVAGDFPIAIVRDTSYLTWRYRQNPLIEYVILGAERGTSLVGYAVLSPRDVEGKRSLAVAELLVKPGDEGAGVALLAEATTVARRLDCSQIQCLMLSRYPFYQSMLRKSGFIYWPFRVSPGAFRYKAPYIVRPHPSSARFRELTTVKNWFLSLGDHDYY